MKASDINGESIKRIAKLEDRPGILIDMDRLMEKSWITDTTKAI
jgi:hypothetical protein